MNFINTLLQKEIIIQHRQNVNIMLRLQNQNDVLLQIEIYTF